METWHLGNSVIRYGIKSYQTGDLSCEKGRFPWPLKSDLSVSTSGKPCAWPVCQHPIMETLQWAILLYQRAAQPTCSGKCSIRETLHESSHFMAFLFNWVCSLLPAIASTCGGLTSMVYGTTLLINVKLWQVKAWGLAVIASDCKNVFKTIYREVLIPTKSIQHAQNTFIIQ